MIEILGGTLFLNSNRKNPSSTMKRSETVYTAFFTVLIILADKKEMTKNGSNPKL